MQKLTKLTSFDLLELERIVTHNITFINENLLPITLVKQTTLLLKSIDPNDTPFVALTKHLGGKLWTGDLQLYNGLKAKLYKDILTTTELYLLLKEIDLE